MVNIRTFLLFLIKFKQYCSLILEENEFYYILQFIRVCLDRLQTDKLVTGTTTNFFLMQAYEHY